MLHVERDATSLAANNVTHGPLNLPTGNVFRSVVDVTVSPGLAFFHFFSSADVLFSVRDSNIGVSVSYSFCLLSAREQETAELKKQQPPLGNKNPDLITLRDNDAGGVRSVYICSEYICTQQLIYKSTDASLKMPDP